MRRHIGHAQAVTDLAPLLVEVVRVPARTRRRREDHPVFTPEVPARRYTSAVIANSGSATVRSDESVLPLSRRRRPTPCIRAIFPETVIVPASSSKSSHRNASISDRRNPVAMNTVIGSTRSAWRHTSDARNLSNRSRSCAAVRAGALRFAVRLDPAHLSKRIRSQNIIEYRDLQRAPHQSATVAGHVRAVRQAHRPNHRVEPSRRRVTHPQRLAELPQLPGRAAVRRHGRRRLAILLQKLQVLFDEIRDPRVQRDLTRHARRSATLQRLDERVFRQLAMLVERCRFSPISRRLLVTEPLGLPRLLGGRLVGGAG